MKNDDSIRLVDRQKENRRYDSQFHFLNDNQLQYRSGLRTGCCTLGDNAALRCIIIWMCTVAVVVFIALVVEIISQEHQVQIGDIVTGHKNCSDIGAWVLSQGGNAVDAAVAAGFCIAVALPHLASLGGGGVLLLHQSRENKTTVVDFRELSPNKLQIQRYIDNPDIGRVGRASIATPGFVAGLKYARDKYGSHEVRSECCSWFDLLSQTVKLLDQGIPLPPNWNNLTADENPKSDQLVDFISSGGYSRFKSPYREMMRTTLEEIISDPTSIYQGTLSHRIPHDLKDQVRQEDLSMYSVKERTPLSSWYSDYQVFTPPPPFSGAAVLGILNGLELIKKSSVHSLSKHPGDSSSKSEYSSKLYNVIERVLDEQEKLGDWNEELDEGVEEKGGDDPAPPAEEPQQGGDVVTGGDEKKISIRDRTKYLINIKNAESWMSGRKEYISTTDSGNGEEEGTSIVVMDNKDNYVSLVLSLGSRFGSQVFSQGILMNNAMASFHVPNEEDTVRSGNQLGEGKRPLSYSSPTIILDRQKPCGTRLVLGSPAPEITAQVLSPVVSENKSDILLLVSEPRLIYWNHTISKELDYKSENFDIQQSSFSGNPVYVLEKTQNRVNGVVDRREGGDQGGWNTLSP